MSGIVNRGCHDPPCGTGPVDGGWERSVNFRRVLDVFFDGLPPPAFVPLDSPTSGSSISNPAPNTSPATIFANYADVATKKRTNVIFYTCSDIDIPSDSPVIDILFDYEAYLPDNARVEQILPGLKENILGEVASELGCVSSDTRRNLRTELADNLLGILTTNSDVIDDKKGTCANAEENHCVPVVGHIAAIVAPAVSSQVINSTKSILLQSIQHGIENHASTAYVGEHEWQGGIVHSQEQPIDSAEDDLTSGKSNNGTVAGVIVALLVVVTLSLSVIVKIRRRSVQVDTMSEGLKDDNLENIDT